MTGKDPKDMTASELLLGAASGIKGHESNVLECLLDLTGKSFYCDAFKMIANKIDAELTDARADGISEGIETSMRADAETWAKANGWPDFREGEDFGAWLDRCTYKKLVDDCNEPVQFGDEIELHHRDGDVDKGRLQEVVVNKGPVWMLSFTGVDHEHLHRYDSECDVLKRPAPEVLGADGMPVVAGETVYRLTDGTAWKVTKLHHSEPRISVVSVGGKGVTAGGWFLANEYTHTPPDTQEKIDNDATKLPAAYCAARGIDLGDDADREDATTTMVRDLLRRQRLLDGVAK